MTVFDLSGFPSQIFTNTLYFEIVQHGSLAFAFDMIFEVYSVIKKNT